MLPFQVYELHADAEVVLVVGVHGAAEIVRINVAVESHPAALVVV